MRLLTINGTPVGASSPTRRRASADQLGRRGHVVAQLDHGDAARHRLAHHPFDAVGRAEPAIGDEIEVEREAAPHAIRASRAAVAPSRAPSASSSAGTKVPQPADLGAASSAATP